MYVWASLSLKYYAIKHEIVFNLNTMYSQNG